MATQYSNKPIITDGLVYALDFGNQKSYVSGSATANSLVYNPVPARFETLLPGDYGTPAAAYSVRKVVSSYTGSAMQVQSASATLDIGFDSNGNLDTASLASFAGSGNAFVKIWYDQSGNGRDASQATAINQPQIVSSGGVILKNGKPAVQFETSNVNVYKRLQTDAFSSSLSQPVTSFIAFNQETTDDRQHIFDGRTNAFGLYIQITDYSQAAGGAILNPNLSTGSKLAYSLFNTTNSELSINNNTLVLGNSGINSLDGLSLGNIRGVPNPGSNRYTFIGQLYELILYPSNRSSSRSKIEDNINRYYNLYTSSYNPTPIFDRNILNFKNDSGALNTQQSFPGFSYNQGNLTLIFTGETKASSSLFSQDSTVSIISNTSSIGYGSSTSNLGRTFPATGFDHISLRFTTGSIDCFVNGIPTAPNSIFPTGSIAGGGKLTIPNYSGSLGNLLVYNRQLTDDEIYAIYSQQARRYGLIEQDKPYTTDSSVYAYTQAAGITGSSVITALDAFVVGLKANNLWNKMIAIYPFLGSDTTKTRYNLKDPSLNTTQINYSGSWSSSLSGSYNNNTSSYGIMRNIKGDYFHPLINSQSIHLSYLSYDTPVSGGFAIGAVTGSTGIESGSAIFISPTEISSSANNVLTGSLVTGGPIGLITVSRTGSTNFKLWKNRVPTTITARASSSINSELYLNAANLNNSLFSGSQNNVSYASVGAGLTDDEVYTYYELVDDLQTGLGRGVTDPTAFITTWDTRISGTGTVTGTSSIALPLYGTQAITASWGDGTVSLISQSTQLAVTHSYATPGIYTVSITGTGQGFRFNNGGDRNKLMDIGQWGSISGSWSNTFIGCFNLIATTPDALVLETTNLELTFDGASRFNGYINNWNTSNVTGMIYMFRNATSFNQNIGSWNTGNVTAMIGMFNSATSFNQNIGSWNTGKVARMDGMFNAVTVFNQNIGSWDVSKVTNMSYMLFNATTFNNLGSNSINNWRPISCSTFQSMFQNALAFNQPIGNWTIGTGSQIPGTGISMGGMFGNADAFNQNIGAWNVEKVTSMANMFDNTNLFNNSGSSDINNWRPISCSSFSNMFINAPSFNQPIGNWTIGTGSQIPVTGINMGSMLRNADAFNQNIGAWNVEKVTSMAAMFQDSAGFNNSGSSDINNWRPISCSNFGSMFQSATAFNQPIGNWTIGTGSQIPATGIYMASMFNNADAFNQNIGAWNVEKVTNMSSMFVGNRDFNNSGSSDINNWRPISCSNFSSMFQSATAFNQPVEGWTLPTNRTYSMQNMFSGATSFNQPLGNWNIVSCSNMASMLNNCGMGIGEYSATLVGWATQPDSLIPRNLTLGATGRQYDTPGSASRVVLTSAPYNWNITGDTYVP